MQFQAITSALLAACLASAAAVPHAPRAEVRATLNLFKADNAGSSNCAGFPIQQTSVTEDCQNANRTLLGGQGDYYRANLLTVQEGWKGKSATCLALKPDLRSLI